MGFHNRQQVAEAFRSTPHLPSDRPGGLVDSPTSFTPSKPRLTAFELQCRLSIANRLSIVLCLLPFLFLMLKVWQGALGANPVETLTRETGIWALRLLWLTLLISPMRKLTGWQWLPRLRRVPSLFCFFYASLHLLIYLVFEHEVEIRAIWRDVVARPYVIMGFISFAAMAPLALTSSDAAIRWLGGRRWRNLHRLTYLAAIAAVAHYLLLVKRDITSPAIYIVLLAVLFYARMAKVDRRTFDVFRSDRF